MGISLTDPAVLRALATAPSLTSGASELLESVGSSLRWQYAALWLIDETGELAFAGDWASGAAYAEFAIDSRRRGFTPGEGLPGHTIQSAASIWITDVESDPRFIRRLSARRAGLRTAVAVPVSGAERPIGALEVLSERSLARDEGVLEMLEAVAVQTGLAVEAWWAQERRRRSDATRSAVVAGALDCIAIMDARGRIVEFNPAAERTFGYSRAEAIGSELASLIIPDELRDAHRAALARYLETGAPTIMNKRLELEASRRDGGRFPVELTVIPLREHGPPLFAGFVRDLTPLHEAARAQERLATREREARLSAQAAERSYRELSHTLQTSLLPPELPAVPGFEVAAYFKAGATGLRVGGDFYDVYETRSGWHAVIGDVCGKGAEGASIAALSRYTVRAASMRDESPREILGVLNEALLSRTRDESPKLCSVAYVNLTAKSLSLGGHPPPLVLRADGSAAAAGVPGTILGVTDAAELHDTPFELGPADCLLLYTDGLTEARGEGGMLDEEGLRAMIEEIGPLGAEELIREIVAETFERRGYVARDDVALLAIASAR